MLIERNLAAGNAIRNNHYL